MRDRTAPLARNFFRLFGPAAESSASKKTSKCARFPRRRAWREIAAQARQAARVDSATRTQGGSAIIAQIPVSAAAPARAKAAASHGDRPSGNENRGAATAGELESERDMTANDNTSGAVFARVADLAALVFSGADAPSFMQGQFSNDVAALPEGEGGGGGTGGWQRSAYCSPKGRMLASFILCRRPGGDHAMLLPADIADDTARRLRMFVLRAKVEIARAPAAFVFASGKFKSEDGSENGLGFFSDRDEVLTIGEGSGRRLLCHLRGEAEKMIPAGAAFSPDGLAWRRAQIADAVPWVRSATREMFIPQTVNFEAPPLSGVNFQKGCYVGQEVVARLHYRGRVKRRARPAVGAGTPPEPGAVVRDSGGQAMGNVVDAVAAANGNGAESNGNGGVGGEGNFSALVCAQLSAGELFLEDGRRVRLLPPPHPLPDGESDGKSD